MTTDYVAAALAVAETPSEAPAAPAAGVTVAQPLEAEVSAAEAKDGETPAAEPAKEPEAAKPVDKVAKGYEDLARDKAALRAEREELKQYRALADAKKNGDAMALLAAAGIPWSKAAEQVLASGSLKAEKEEPEVDPRDARLAALEQEISSRKEAETKASVLSAAKARTGADPEKFKLVAKMGEEGKAIRYIEQYFSKFGELPGETLDESIELALEAVEQELSKESKRWESVLTSFKGASTVPAKSAVPADGAVSKQAPKTLTNNVGAGPAPASAAPKKPKTDAEYVAAAIEAISAQ